MTSREGAGPSSSSARFAAVPGAPTVEAYRAGYDKVLGCIAPPAGAEVVARDVGGVEVLAVTMAGVAPCRTVVWFHGGGYMCGRPEGLRDLAARLAVGAQAEVLLPRYRLAPEAPYPAALDDAIAVLAQVCEQVGASSLVVGGDSAGGGLAVAAVSAHRDAGRPRPAGLVTFSGLFDLAASGATWATKAEVDHAVTEAVVELSAGAYLGDRDRRTPGASPLYGDPAGLPPLLLQVGSQEVLLDDSVRLAAAAGAAGVVVRLEVVPAAGHVFQLLAAGGDGRALAAVERAARFVRQRTPGGKLSNS